MKLSEVAKCYEECFGPDNSDGAGGCLYQNCPLHKPLEINVGDPEGEGGQITWKFEGCSLVGLLEDQLEDKTPGVPYPEEG